MPSRPCSTVASRHLQKPPDCQSRAPRHVIVVPSREHHLGLESGYRVATVCPPPKISRLSSSSPHEGQSDAAMSTTTPIEPLIRAFATCRRPPSSPSAAGELLFRSPSPPSLDSPPHHRPCSEPQTEMAAVRRWPLLFVSVAGGTRCISRSSSEQARTRDRRRRGAAVPLVPFRFLFLAATPASERREPTPPF
jgi:hypothetical protein